MTSYPPPAPYRSLAWLHWIDRCPLCGAWQWQSTCRTPHNQPDSGAT